MKSFILIAMALFLSLAGKSQQTTNAATPTVDKANYQAEYKSLKDRSRSEKTIAQILNITGIVLCSGGTIVWVIGEVDKSARTDDGYGDQTGGFLGGNVNDQQIINTGIGLTATGIALGITSAVFYTRSGVLYHKAREIKMSMNSNSVNIPVSGMQTYRAPQLGLGISVSL